MIAYIYKKEIGKVLRVLNNVVDYSVTDSISTVIGDKIERLGTSLDFVITDEALNIGDDVAAITDKRNELKKTEVEKLKEQIGELQDTIIEITNSMM